MRKKADTVQYVTIIPHSVPTPTTTDNGENGEKCKVHQVSYYLCCVELEEKNITDSVEKVKGFWLHKQLLHIPNLSSV